MFQLLLTIIYLAFISLGLPDSLLGSAWPTMYKELSKGHGVEIYLSESKDYFNFVYFIIGGCL